MDRLRSTRSRDHPSSIFLRHRTHHLLFGVFHLRGDLAHGPPRPAQTSSFLRQQPLQNLDETFDVPDFPEISQPPVPPPYLLAAPINRTLLSESLPAD